MCKQSAISVLPTRYIAARDKDLSSWIDPTMFFFQSKLTYNFSLI